MKNALDDLLPPLQPNEYVLPQKMRVEGQEIVLPLHLFVGSGDSAFAEARLPVEGADETTIKAAVAIAVDEARGHLAVQE